jgi:hypothetical protein
MTMMMPLISIIIVGIILAVVGYFIITKFDMKDTVMKWISYPVTLILRLFGKKEGYGFLGFPGYGGVEYQWMGNNRDHVHPYVAAQEGHGLNCLIPGACDHAKNVYNAFGPHLEPNPTHATAIDNFNRKKRELQDPTPRKVWDRNIGQNVRFPTDSTYVHDPVRVQQISDVITNKISNGYDTSPSNVPLTYNDRKIVIPTNPLVNYRK